jgi:hypothetical protein
MYEQHHQQTQQIEMVADRLSQEAIAQGRRAVVGLLAVPASIALGLAATVTWATAFIERGFETFELSMDRIRRVDELPEGQREPLLGRGDERSSKKTATSEARS